MKPKTNRNCNKKLVKLKQVEINTNRAQNSYAFSMPEYNLQYTDKKYKWMYIVSLMYICWYLFLKTLLIFIY